MIPLVRPARDQTGPHAAANQNEFDTPGLHDPDSVVTVDTFQNYRELW